VFVQGPKSKLEAGKPIPRRRFLRRLAWASGGGALGIAGVGAYARWVEPYRVEYHDVEVAIEGLPPAFDGFTIAHVTDIHCGKFLGPERVRAVFDRVRERKPNAVAVTGDLVCGGEEAYPAVLRELAALARDLPVYVVPGNHDYWQGIEHYRKGVPAAGAVDLTNAHRIVERNGARLVIAGLDDLWEGGPDLDRALAGVDRDAQPVVLLMHNPDDFANVRGRGVALVLAGHTHGGQVKPPFMTPPILPVRNRKYAAGLFREEGTAMYVSRGVGMILKWRLNCRPEVAYVVLRR